MLGTGGPCEVVRAGTVEVIPGDEAGSTIEAGIGLWKSQGTNEQAGKQHSTPTTTSPQVEGNLSSPLHHRWEAI